MTITISHTPTDGTLVEGTSRGDGTNTILKSAGFRWFRTLGLWGIAGSRDRDPQRGRIEKAAAALRAAGHAVEVSIDDGAGCVAPSTETIEAGTYTPLARPLFIYVGVDAANANPSPSPVSAST